MVAGIRGPQRCYSRVLLIRHSPPIYQIVGVRKRSQAICLQHGFTARPRFERFPHCACLINSPCTRTYCVILRPIASVSHSLSANTDHGVCRDRKVLSVLLLSDPGNVLLPYLRRPLNVCQKIQEQTCHLKYIDGALAVIWKWVLVLNSDLTIMLDIGH